jgi:hypothetical protein
VSRTTGVGIAGANVSKSIVTVLGLVWPAIATSGCTGTVDKVSSGSATPVPAAAATASQAPEDVFRAEGFANDVSDVEARRYADRFIAAWNERRPAELKSLVDYELLCRIAVCNVNNRRIADHIVADNRRTVAARPAGLFDVSMGEGIDFTLVCTSTDPRGRRVILRRMNADGNVGYVELTVVRSSQGVVVASDVYMYESGEWFSDHLRRLASVTPIDGMAANVAVAAAEGVAPADAERRRTAFVEMAHLRKAKHLPEAIDVYRNLPERLRRDRLLLDCYLKVAKDHSAAELSRARQSLRAFYGDSDWANYQLLMDDEGRRDFQSCLTRIDRLDAQLGLDPYLDVQRGQLHLAMGDAAAAISAGIRAADALPDFRPAQAELVNLALAARRFDLVRRGLLTLERRFQDDVDAAVAGPVFEPFRQSTDYEQWRADRRTSGS